MTFGDGWIFFSLFWTFYRFNLVKKSCQKYLANDSTLVVALSNNAQPEADSVKHPLTCSLSEKEQLVAARSG